MEKFIFMMLTLLVSAGGVYAQETATTTSDRKPELIVVAGGGLSKQNAIQNNNYGYLQSRLMFGKGNRRAGFSAEVIKDGGNTLTQKPNPGTQGTELIFGPSVDVYGRLSYSYDYYFWLIAGAKYSMDKYGDANYSSNQNTTGVSISGGLQITSIFPGLFSNHCLMYEYNKPLDSKINASFRGEPVINPVPYNKESIRVVLESAIARFGKRVQFEPYFHLGAGKFTGSDYSFYEAGGGVDFGRMKVYYHKILQVGVFVRQGFNVKGASPLKKQSIITLELSFSPSAL